MRPTVLSEDRLLTEKGARAGVVIELRPIDNWRICPYCLVINSALDASCAGCDAKMPTLSGADSAEIEDENRSPRSESLKPAHGAGSRHLIELNGAAPESN